MLDSAFCGAGINIPPVIVEMKNLMKDLKGLLGEFRGWPTVELFSVRQADWCTGRRDARGDRHSDGGRRADQAEIGRASCRERV